MIDELVYSNSIYGNDQFNQTDKNPIWDEHFVSVMDKFLCHPFLSSISYCFLGMTAAGALSFQDVKKRHWFNRYSTYAFYFFSALLGIASYPHLNKNEALSHQSKQTLSSIVLLQVGVALYKEYWKIVNSRLKPSAPSDQKGLSQPDKKNGAETFSEESMPSPLNTRSVVPFNPRNYAKPSEKSVALFMSAVTPFKSISRKTSENLLDHYFYLTKLENYEHSAFKEYFKLKNRDARGEDISAEIAEFVCNIKNEMDITYEALTGQRISVQKCSQKVREYLLNLVPAQVSPSQKQVKALEVGADLIKLKTLHRILDALQFYARLTQKFGVRGYNPLAYYYSELVKAGTYFDALKGKYGDGALVLIRKLKNLSRIAHGKVNKETAGILEKVDLYDLAFKRITSEKDFKELCLVFKDLSLKVNAVKMKIEFLRSYVYSLNISLPPSKEESSNIKGSVYTIISSIRDISTIREVSELKDRFLSYIKELGADTQSEMPRSGHDKKLLPQRGARHRTLLLQSAGDVDSGQVNKQ